MFSNWRRPDSGARNLEVRLLFVLGCDEGGVVPAEAERIVDRDPHLLFARDVRRVIQVAFRIGILEIDRGRNFAVANRQGADRHLDRAGSS